MQDPGEAERESEVVGWGWEEGVGGLGGVGDGGFVWVVSCVSLYVHLPLHIYIYEGSFGVWNTGGGVAFTYP